MIYKFQNKNIQWGSLGKFFGFYGFAKSDLYEMAFNLSWFCPDDCYYQISTNLMDEWLKKVNKQMWFIALFKGSLL